MKGRRSTIGLAIAGVSALVLSACGGSSDSGSATEESVAPDQIQTDVGVTAEPCPEAVNPTNGCIYLGIISDLTEGPFAPLATQVVAGQEAFWANVNANGGISGYDVNVTQYTRDNKYDPAVHSQEYRSIEPNILALAQTLGTSQTQAILSDMDADNVIGTPASWWSGWQFPEDDKGVILESGSSYCIAAMSGLDWWTENKGTINKIVAVGPRGDYGGDFAAGVEAWAQANNVEYGGFIESASNAQAGNQDAAVSQILSSGADVVAMGTGPLEVGEIVGKTSAQGYAGQYVGAAPTWNPILLALPAGQVLKERFTNFGTTASFGTTDTPASQAMQAQLGAGNKPTNDGYTYGWVWQYPLLAAIEAAAAKGDLTREGLRSAVAEGIEVDYQGALPTSEVNGPSDTVNRTVSINVPDDTSPLGINTIVDGYLGATAEAYDYSKPCSSTG